jgi:hypothetical protein
MLQKIYKFIREKNSKKKKQKILWKVQLPHSIAQEACGIMENARRHVSLVCYPQLDRLHDILMDPMEACGHSLLLFMFLTASVYP